MSQEDRNSEYLCIVIRRTQHQHCWRHRHWESPRPCPKVRKWGRDVSDQFPEQCWLFIALLPCDSFSADQHKRSCACRTRTRPAGLLSMWFVGDCSAVFNWSISNSFYFINQNSSICILSSLSILPYFSFFILGSSSAASPASLPLVPHQLPLQTKKLISIVWQHLKKQNLSGYL